MTSAVAYVSLQSSGKYDPVPIRSIGARALAISLHFCGLKPELAIQLAQAKTEADLLGWCIELSRAAFIGIDYDQVSWALADEILADAELISMTFTASSENPQ